MEFYRASLRDATNQMDSFGWFNAQINNCRLGTHPKGRHSVSMCKMFLPNTRADVGMVQCVPARYGKTTWQKNRRNEEGGWSMQRGRPVGPCTRRRAVPCKTQVINMR